MVKNLVEKIELAIGESLHLRGYGIVSVGVSGGNKPIVEVLIERLDETSVSVSDCTTASKVISALLDIENIINKSYTLNVSSPGIDRPLTKLEHFSRFIGKDAVVELVFPISGRRKFTGTITAVQNFQNMPHILLYLSTEQKTINLPFENVRKAKLKI